MAQPLTFVPPPQEQPYYDGLFSVADVARSGTLGGKEAVGFLSRSKLPVELLRNIWTMADNPKTNSLDRAKFHVAVRLIQLFQNGQKAQDAQLSAAAGVAMRPAFFEGVSGVSVPMPGQPQPPAMAAAPPSPAAPPQQPPPPQQQQQQPPPPAMQQQRQQPPPPAAMQPPGQPSHGASVALVAQDPYVMHPHEQSRYESLFPQYETKGDGYVYGAEAVALFSKSGLERENLRDVWNMCDDPVDNRLDKLEFAVAMHLIVCISKKNLPVPPSLPPSLQAIKDKARGGGMGAAGSSPGMQAQQPPPPQQLQPAAAFPSPTLAPQQPGGMGMSQQQQQSPASPVPQQQQMAYGQQGGGGAMGGIPSPGLAPQQPPAAAMGMQGYRAPPPPQQQQPPQTGMGPSGMAGPPPLRASGGMSISDAFEGLSPDAALGASAEETEPPALATEPAAAPAAGFGGGVPSPKMGGHDDGAAVGAGAAGGGMPEISIGNAQREAQHRVSALTMQPPSPSKLEVEKMSSPAVVPSEPPKSGAALSKSYKMEDESGELVKLRATLQRLQAENISLKAKLGDVSEEEKEVRREIHATVSEIGKLSQELNGLRERVTEAKASLIEATAELKAQQEKKGMVSDLIDDAQQTLGALDAANESLKELKDSANAIEQKQAAATAAGSAFESDLFGGFDDGPSAPAAAPAPAEPEPPAPEPAAPPAPAAAMERNEPPLGHEPLHQEQHHFGAPPAPAPAPTPSAANPMALMGGSAPAPPASFHEEPSHAAAPPPAFPTPAPMGGAPQTGGGSSLSADAFGHGPLPPQPTAVASAKSAEEIEELKAQAAKMDEVSREAESMQRRLTEKVDNMKKIAEQAESEATEKKEQAEMKKKKKFGGGKKTAAREAEVAEKDAAEKRKHAADAQTELANAQAQAIKARRAADEYRQQAEQAELQAAAALSVVSQVTDERKRADDGPSPAVAPSGSMSSGMGYGGGMGSMGMGMGSGGGGIMGGGSGVMGSMTSAMTGGGGGESGGIPSPSGSENGDAYSNPFGGF